ncbi:MAG: AEC family transporter [Eubacteriales bacterium]|nr:AEC family transporter [Eubacteriales bacterium]
MVTTLLLKQLVIFFIYMGAGFILVKLGIMKAEDSRIFSLLSIYVLLPCAILKSYQADYTPELRDGFMLAMGAALASQLILMAVTYAISRFYKLDATEKASIMYPNSANLILPLVAGVLGDHYMIYASAYSCVQGLFIWTHCTSMMKGTKDLNWKKVFLNLNLIAVVVGIILFFAQVHFPGLILDTLGGFSAALGPISMIVIGMLLYNVDWKNLFSNKRVYFVVALKMVILPLIAAIIFKYSGIHTLVKDGDMILLVTLFAIMAPSATLITQLAQLNNRDEKYAAAINALTTVLCIFTMPMITMWYMG